MNWKRHNGCKKVRVVDKENETIAALATFRETDKKWERPIVMMASEVIKDTKGEGWLSDII